MKVRAYIDGYNLFYGALKAGKIKSSVPQEIKQKIKKDKRALRWLNVEKLLSYYLKGNYTLEAIHFYTADIATMYIGDLSPSRQKEYFKALSSIKNLSIHKGRFYRHPVLMPRAPITNPLSMVKVIKTEEKGSDVNLATHLVYDACQNLFDMAVIVTNDSDLLEPIKVVKSLNKKVLILCPHSKICHEFLQTFGKQVIRKIEKTALEKAQFEDNVLDVNGNILASRPDVWKK